MKSCYQYNQQSEQKRFDQLLHSFTLDSGELFYAGHILQRAAQTYGDSPALIFENQYISFIQLYQRSLAFAQILQSRNVLVGDRILICFENSPEFYIAYFAAWQAGAVVAPLNTFLKEHEITHITSDCNPKIIITSADRVSLFSSANIPILTPADMPETAPLSWPTLPSLPSDAMCGLIYIRNHRNS